MLCLKGLDDPLDGLFRVLPGVEGSQPEVTLAADAESGAGRSDDPRLLKEQVEKLPRGEAARRFQPNVRGVDPAVNLEARRGKPFADDPRVILIIGDVLFHLGHALFGINGLGGALHHIGDAVHLRGLPAAPELVEGNAAEHQFLRHDGERAAGSGEAGRLGKAAELDRAGSRALDLVDAVRQVLRDIRFVGRVVQDHGLVLVRIIDPFFQLIRRDSGAGGVVREAEVNDVGFLLRQLRQKMVLFAARHVNDPVPALAFLILPGAARHDVGVHVNRVDRVAHRNHVVRRENVADIARVGLRAVADEDLVDADIDAALSVVVFRNCLSQELIAAFRAVAAERLHLSHFLRRLRHGLDDRFRERKGDVADSEADDRLFRMLFRKFIDAGRDIHK